MQWDEREGKNRDDALLRRRGLRRQQQPARPLEHGVLHRGPPRHRTARRRPDLQEGPGLRLALPEPQERVQRSALGRQGQRRRLHLHARPTAATSMAGKTDDGGLRSYASMTYAGLKSMIYAGLDQDDPRVKAALTYISQALHPRREPGPGPAGAVLLLPHLRQGDGRARQADARRRHGQSPTTGGPSWSPPWRSAQQPDGGWVNPADRFMEGDPNLVTAYGLLALAYTRKK